MANLFALITFFFSSSAFCWGQTGHRVIGEIAESYIKKETPEKIKTIRKLLNGDNLAKASTWADEMRSNPGYKHANPWHYVSIPDGKSYSQIYTNSKKAKPNIVWAINKNINILKNKKSNNTEKGVALKWLVHLVGDIHQPLHVGRKKDKGGNTIKRKWFGEHTNLHSIWDDKIISSKQLSFTEYVSFYFRPTLKSKKWDNLNILDWTKEAMAYRHKVYDYPKKSKRYWEYNYIYQHLPYVNNQLNLAGYRLAKILQKYL